MSYLWRGLGFLLDGDIEIRKIKQKRIEKSVFMNEMKSNIFISDEINDFIKKNWDGVSYMNNQYVINNKLKIEWNVVELTNSNNNYDLNDKIVKIIYNLYKNSVCYRPESCEIIRIGFWNTPFIKHLPVNGKADFFHINSACTYHYYSKNIGNIYIWREQEWLKTLFHEVIHAFKYDFKLKHFGFCCSNKNLGNEAYVEWVGVLLTILFLSVNKTDFIKKYNEMISHNIKNLEIIKPYFFNNKDKIKVNILGYWILNSYFWFLPNSILKEVIKNKFHITPNIETMIRIFLEKKFYQDKIKLYKNNKTITKPYPICVLPSKFTKTEI